MNSLDNTNFQNIKHQKAFTLIEVLISIALLGIVIVALFSTVSMMRDSNSHLYSYLQKAKIITKATKVLYLDILNSDGNITIKKDEFTRLCMNETRNSFYALSLVKVCWIVLKKDNTLARIEGNNYQLPTRLEDRIEVNKVMKNIEIFDVYHEKDKVLVFIKQKMKEPITFLIQGVNKPRIKVITNTKDNNTSKNQPPKGRQDPNNPQNPIIGEVGVNNTQRPTNITGTPTAEKLEPQGVSAEVGRN